MGLNHDLLNLKTKTASHFTSKRCDYLGIAANCNLGQANYSKTHRRVWKVMEDRGEWEGCCKQSTGVHWELEAWCLPIG